MTGPLRTLGLLHTGAAHVATFDRLGAELLPGVALRHAVRQDLLDRARAEGPSDAVRAGVREALDALAADGVDRVVCTCSTIGGLAEDAGAAVPVLRVDRPMAERAAASGRRIGLVMALASTREPSRALLAEYLSGDHEVVDVLVEEAWPAFEAGDTAAYLDTLEAAIRAAAPGLDVLVLAQASAAGVAGRLDDLGVPVLASPETCLARLAADR